MALCPLLGTMEESPLPMLHPAALGPLLPALLALGPSKRQVMLRPQPPYLPHPIRRLARLWGVVVVRAAKA
jgi:hypothetical protein